MKALTSLFIIICLYSPSLIYAVEVCNIPSGCPIDASGICIGCIEIEEEDTEEYKLEEKIEEEESKRFWKNISLKLYGTHASSTFTFAGKNNSKLDRTYIHKVVYAGFSTDATIDYNIVSNTYWLLFIGLGVINYEADLIYSDLAYGSFKYEIDEQSLFFNSGFNYHFLQSNTFLGLGFKVAADSTHKSNSTDKKITQYNSRYTSPMVKLGITTTSISFGMIF